jgi:hypothetical protein
MVKSEFHVPLPDEGYHNKNLKSSVERLEKMGIYKDLSTIIVCPTLGSIPAEVVYAWMHLMHPVNQNVTGPLFVVGKEVGEAYNEIIEKILTDPYLAQFKYVLTVEDDNIPPMDGLLKLYESMEEYDVVGGLYWTKGDLGIPVMLGDPKDYKNNFKIQIPIEDKVIEVNGLGMGFTLFKLDMFRKIEYPWFKTTAEFNPEFGKVTGTQDVYFFNKAKRDGFKFAVDCRVKVGHIDQKTKKVW